MMKEKKNRTPKYKRTLIYNITIGDTLYPIGKTPESVKYKKKWTPIFFVPFTVNDTVSGFFFVGNGHFDYWFAPNPGLSRATAKHELLSKKLYNCFRDKVYRNQIFIEKEEIR